MTRFMLFVTVFSVSISHSQSSNPMPNNVRATNVIDAFANHVGSTGYLLYGIPLDPGNVEGDYYLQSDWGNASIKLFQSEQVFRDVKCKINLLSKQLEIASKLGVRGIEIDKIEYLIFNADINQTKFISVSNFNIDGVPQSGLAELLVDGRVPLVKLTNLIVKRPDYNIQLNVGSKNTRLIQEGILYAVSNNELMKINSIKKKRLPALFKPKVEDMENFIKTMNKGLDKEGELKSIFEFGNQILK